jgi:hypothetical protein
VCRLCLGLRAETCGSQGGREEGARWE